MYYCPLSLLFLLPTVLGANEWGPEELIPKRYILTLKVDSTGRRIEGHVHIEMECKSSYPRTHVRLNKNNHEIAGVIVIKQSNKIIPCHPHYNDERNIVTCVPEDLGTGGFSLDFDYSSPIREDHGYIIWENGNQENYQYMIATNFEREVALFPYYGDHPLKSKYTLKLYLRPHEISFSNTSGQKMGDSGSNEVEYTYEIGKPLAPTQVAFVVTNIPDGDFVDYNYEFSLLQWHPKIKCRKTVCEESNVRHTLSILKGVSKNLGHLGPYFQFPSVTLLLLPTAQPIHSQKWGLVLMSERTFTNQEEKNYNEIIYKIFHGLTSQWFGGMISPDSWNSYWMFKALSVYVAYLEMQLKPFIVDVLALLWQEQKYNLEYTIQNGIDPFIDTTVDFKKGLMMLRMIHLALGESAFVKAINGFITKYQFSYAGLTQLCQAFDRESSGWFKAAVIPEDVTWLKVVDSWKENGYPVVFVEVRGKGRFAISQKSMFTDKQRKDRCWYFPVTYTFASKAKFQAGRASKDEWLGCGRTAITIQTSSKSVEWFIVNPNYAGLYRVMYDDHIRERISKALKTEPKDFHPRIREQLVSDSLTLSWLGLQPYDFNFFMYLKKERDRVVWIQFFLASTNLKEILENTELYETLVIYLRHIFKDGFQNYYKNRREYEYHESKTIANVFDKRFHYWGCVFGEDVLYRTYALRKFDNWVKQKNIFDDTKGKDRVLIPIQICIALLKDIPLIERTHLNGLPRNERIDFFLTFLINRDLDGDINRGMLIEAIGCVRDEPTLVRLLKWTTSSEEGEKATKEEKKMGFLELIRGEFSFLPTLEYFYNNFHAIWTYYESAETISSFVHALTSRMNQSDQTSKMREFIASTEFERVANLRNMNIIWNEFEKGKTIALKKYEWLRKNESKLWDSFSKVYINGMPVREN